MAETESVPHHNGIDTIAEEEECNKTRPADIEADMREMERRKRVEAIMNSRLFREELERIVDGQIREGGPSSILQQLSEVMGVPAARIGSVFKSSNCVVPINDIRGMEAMGYEKGEKILRCKLAATFRLIDLYGWAKGIGSLITARLNADQELFLVNPYGVLNHEITASSLNKVNMQGQIVEQGTTNFGVNTSQFTLHSVIHAARPDIRCAIYVGCNSVIAVSALKQGLLPLTKDAALLGELSVHNYTGALYEPEEKDKLLRSLGPVSKVLLLSNHGAICCGETVEETFYAVNHIVAACEAQLKLMPVGLDNLILIPEETRKAIYDASRKPPEGVASAVASADNKERTQVPKWRVGGAEYEALMRMLDNAGFRTGYIYRNPLVKNDLPKPKNDVEVPPAVSSLGYLIEEEELFRQGIWKKGDFRKGGDRSRWLNSPNVYQKVEVLETGTPDPKKITKWVAEASPTHSSSTPVKIDCAMQFVPPNTNPKEFKRIQQQIKDYRRADKISAGPQSHILEGVSWDEANRLKDANVSATGDHVVLMGAASKGIIQRGYQHNATVYKAPYAKNPFDSVTDDELNEYKKTVEKKRHGDYTDTDFSESEALSSLQISDKPKNQPMSPPSQSEPETDTAAEHQVLRIETKQVPKPSQPEVVLSDEPEEQDDIQFAGFLTGLRSSKNSVGTDSLRLMNTSPASSVVLEWARERDASSLLARMPLTASETSKSYAHATQSFIHLATVGNSPYRTNSFFGFLSPRRMPWIHHFHIPVLPPRYLGRSRSTSLNDVFATERYLSMTDDGLKQTIRRKLHFEQMQCFASAAPSPPSSVNPFRNQSEFDFEIQIEQEVNNNNLERISEVCEARLRQVRSAQQQGSFLGKLDDMQYSKSSTPESFTVYSDVLQSETSLLNHTRELFSDAATASSLNLDEKEWTILEKIDNYSLTYGTLPEVYAKIGEQILNRTNYDEFKVHAADTASAATIQRGAPEASPAGSAREEGMHPRDDYGTDPAQSVGPRSSSVSPKRLSGRKRATPATLNKRTKNRRNRNFIQENIERVKTKQYSSPTPSRSSKSGKTAERKTPLTVKQLHSATRKLRRQSLKRRSLQFNSDHDEEDDEYLAQPGNDQSEQQHLKEEYEQQTQCIAEIGDSLSQMQNDVNEIVQLQGQIDEARATHLEMIAKATLEDCRRVNNDPASSEYAADEE
uniref:Putative cytoskeletal protein adducin n=1 Tax=Culex tarsalis TaxID=7177 RepID=A0A1Q3FXL8_CULTA